MQFFFDWILPIICLVLAYYFYKNPIDDGSPVIYILLLIIGLALKFGNFAKIIAD